MNCKKNFVFVKVISESTRHKDQIILRNKEWHKNITFQKCTECEDPVRDTLHVNFTSVQLLVWPPVFRSCGRSESLAALTAGSRLCPRWDISPTRSVKAIIEVGIELKPTRRLWSTRVPDLRPGTKPYRRIAWTRIPRKKSFHLPIDSESICVRLAGPSAWPYFVRRFIPRDKRPQTADPRRRTPSSAFRTFTSVLQARVSFQKVHLVWNAVAQ